MSEDLTKCPQCGGEADNGIDRCIPPSAYMCSKCCAQEEAERQAALQESEAGAVPIGYLDRQQLERWERLRGTKYAAAEIGYIGFSKEPFETDLTDCTAPVFLAPPSAQAIETAAIMKCAELMVKRGVLSPDGLNYEALLALTPQDGRTQLEEFGMKVAQEVKSATVYNECRNMLTKENELRAIVTNLIGATK